MRKIVFSQKATSFLVKNQKLFLSKIKNPFRQKSKTFFVKNQNPFSSKIKTFFVKNQKRFSSKITKLFLSKIKNFFRQMFKIFVKNQNLKTRIKSVKRFGTDPFASKCDQKSPDASKFNNCKFQFKMDSRSID